MMVGGGTSGTSKPSWTLEAAFAQIQQLLGMVNSLQQTIAQQEQTITQLQNQPPPPPAGSQPSRGPKMATLPLFNRSMATCEAFINAYKDYVGTGIHAYLESTKPDPIELLYADIYKAFSDPNKQATTIQEIMMIKQVWLWGNGMIWRYIWTGNGNKPLPRKRSSLPEAEKEMGDKPLTRRPGNLTPIKLASLLETPLPQLQPLGKVETQMRWTLIATGLNDVAIIVAKLAILHAIACNPTTSRQDW
ncbi:hypothetical protein AMATHDRAFT_11343 [Amanita thiersii Skay4041]|uniref:Uncharacterized protein n=1 Tax=Amanita thiersii Skay4041 TaxID=703135 RepID=A0A2A9N912_9AGAR|nr:hypothetical protein AMATHDRAFT_11343 [Amanita thiersii Skay4041]